MALIQCATSNNVMSPAELLAIRDRADALDNTDIVHAIDSYFEAKEA
jgi:ATP-dependent 26S proteasome regulatory subunit